MKTPILVWIVGWMGAFLALELPAHYGLVPWPTLSRFFWEAEAEWHPTSLFVEVFLAVLCAHIVFRLTVAALIAVVVCALLALAVHFAFGAA